MDDFRPFFEADKKGASANDLKAVYATLRSTHPDLPQATTRPKMIEALRLYEEAHPDLCMLIPSEDQFYGFSKGTNRLAKHVQWVFVPAVKDAATEQVEGKNTALEKLLARTVRARVNFKDAIESIRSDARTRYQEVIAQRQEDLDGLSRSLQERIAAWAHPGARLKLQWQHEPDRSIRVDEPFAEIIAGEGTFSGKLARFGHGLQRAYLLALLQELSQSSSAGEPTLILAVEEPELYQHPPQCRHMATVLQNLEDQQAQVVVATHSPYFVGGQSFESVRFVRKDAANSQCHVVQVSLTDLGAKLAEVREKDPPRALAGVLAKIDQCLRPSLNEIFFSPFLVLVEGREDIAYIVTYLTLLGHEEALRRASCNFVATDGKSKMITPLAIVKGLNIPTFTIFDADGHAPDKSGSKEKHRKDNLALLRLSAVPDPDPFPGEPFWGTSVVMWHSDITNVVAADFGGAWASVKAAVEAEFGHAGDLDKDPLFIARTVEEAWNRGLRSPLLERLCMHILRFCTATSAHPPLHLTPTHSRFADA
jgi:putative ATP-dependent endonuclease of OLD family